MSTPLRHSANPVQRNGIQETRKRAIPAYTFELFPKLPVELRHKIWSMATRTEEPKIHTLAPLEPNFRNYPRRRGIHGSSPIDLRGKGGQPNHKLLRICRESRMVARTIFTRMPFKMYYVGSANDFAYFNTLYDTFYIGGYLWDEFKILVDLLIKLNTTRALQPKVSRDIERLQNIRLLTVDLNIYGALPPRLWAEFPKLEVLTIAFYPYPTIADREPEISRNEGLEFIKPRRRSKFGKRAEWIFKSATESFECVKKGSPLWKIPKIEVVVRMTGKDLDFETYWDLYGDESEDEDEDEDELEDEDDDSIYLQQLEARMSHEVSRDQIKELKHTHHPGRVVNVRQAKRLNKPVGSYFTDSERESGGKEFSAWDSDSGDE